MQSLLPALGCDCDVTLYFEVPATLVFLLWEIIITWDCELKQTLPPLNEMRTVLFQVPIFLFFNLYFPPPFIEID